MNLTVHLARKDWRHSRLILCIWYPILVLALTLDQKIEMFLDERVALRNIPSPSAAELEYGVLALIGILAVSLDLLLRAAIVSRLVHDDSTVGTTAFWLSRPVPAGRLLVSKAMLLLPAMVLPQIVVHLAVTYQLAGFPSTAPEVFLAPVVSTAIFMMLAVLTPSLAGMAVLGGIMTGVILGGLLLLSWLGMPLVGAGGIVGGLTGEWPWLTALAVCVSVICHQYLTRRTKRSLAVAFSGVLVFLLVLSGEWILGGA